MLERSRKARLIAPILTTFLIVGMAEPALSQPSPQQDRSHQATNQEDSAEDAPAASTEQQPVSAYSSQRIAQQNVPPNNGANGWLSNFLGYIRITEFLMVAFTLAVAFFTGKLWFATKQIADAEEKIAAIGKQQIKDTRTLQRAYIGVDPGGVKLWSDGEQLVAHVLIKNAGNLPASKVKWTIYFRPDPCRERKVFDIVESDVDGSHFIVPHGTLRFGSRRIDLQEAIKMRDAGPCHLYAWGRVDYLDGFNCWQSTRFCHRYDWGQTKDFAKGEYELAADTGRSHRYGNCTT